MDKNNELIRLNKYLTSMGVCSRREADKLISNGRVKINSKVAVVGQKISESDKILVNNQAIRKEEERVYLVLNKPVGITCTTEKKVKDNIIHFINYKKRIFNIGRLDKPSEGLILMTNDGEIVNKILRASNNHEKEYIVTVDKPIDNNFIKKMGNGIPILETVTNKCKVSRINDYTFKIILTQGLNRQIRRMCEYLNYEVVKLKRIRIMNIKLGTLQIGQWRYVTNKEMKVLNNLLSDSKINI